MKKLFLLIIASWATSCLPAPDAPRLSVRAQAEKSLNTLSKNKANEIIRKNQLNKSFNGGLASGYIGMIVPLGCATALGWTAGAPLVALGLGTAVVCSLVQDRYMTSDFDKNKTTGKERTLQHLEGIGLVAVTGAIAVASKTKLEKNQAQENQ